MTIFTEKLPDMVEQLTSSSEGKNSARLLNAPFVIMYVCMCVCMYGACVLSLTFLLAFCCCFQPCLDVLCVVEMEESEESQCVCRAYSR